MLPLLSLSFIALATYIGPILVERRVRSAQMGRSLCIVQDLPLAKYPQVLTKQLNFLTI